MQAPLPSFPIERGRAGAGLLAHVIVSKYADALPLHRQSVMYERVGVELDRSTMADWVGSMAARRSWALAHKTEVVHFARAFADAYGFMHDPAIRDEVAGIMVETMDIPAPIARTSLALYFEPDRGVMPKRAEISLAGIDKVIELLGTAGELKPPLPAAQRFVDLQVLQAAGVR